ncbi:MAG: cation:proton antiporter [Planctomycetaceae bacterium]|nr:cation:proton antiporter [Planctomycetaceae bacterium]
MNNLQLTIYFFMQIALILGACRAVGLVAARFGQPQVVAEMITGVLLGPSVFGWLLPEAQEFCFPWDSTQKTRDSQSYMFPAAQLGLALYMFIVGMEFRVDIIRAHFKSSIAVSLAGMLAPFVLGLLLASVLFTQTKLFPAETSLFEASLFMGASLCITAFPMLARIIHFKGLAGTRMGTVALGAGAIDDAAAWCLLALVLASFNGDFQAAIVSIGGGFCFVMVAGLVVKPLLRKFQWIFLNQKQELTETGLVLAIIVMALGAMTTDWLHLHAVFGAFIAGATIPRPVVYRQVIERIQPLTVVLLLPLFFTYSGLNTQISLLNTPTLWFISLVVLAVAVLGKGVACWAAARATGIPNREALGIGTLMNARGLMELIIINIGLERGIISGELFAILVIMAIATTLAASPIFEWLNPNRAGDAAVEIDAALHEVSRA